MNNLTYVHTNGNEMELLSVNDEASRDRFRQGHLAWQEGALIQSDRALGWLTIDEREFIISGYTPEDWAALWDFEDE
jgi:hypothetical protein